MNIPMRSALVTSLAALALLGAMAATAKAQERPQSKVQKPAQTQPLSPDEFADVRARDTSEVDRCAGTDEHEDGVREAENRAYEHYERGQRLYEQGDYQAAIDEFVQAYCHRPSASVLKDIGQAYERLVDYERAVAYLERYILESPDGDDDKRRVQAARVQVLRNLYAKLRIATQPEGAKVTLLSEDGSAAATGFSSDNQEIRVRKGVYTVRIELAGYETLTDNIEVKIGQPYSYYYQLQPKKGSLQIVVVPSNARIFVNKSWVALGTYIEQVPIGNYDIHVEADGRLPKDQRVEVTEGNRTTVAVKLEELPRSGRTELIIASTTAGLVLGFGLGLYSEEEGEIAALTSVLGLGVGFSGSYLGIPRDIPVGTSSYIIGSTIIGGIQGNLIASQITCDSVYQEAANEYAEQGCHENAVEIATIAGMATGTLFSVATASRFRLNAGDAALINSGAQWGLASGILFWLVFNSDARLDEPLALGGMNLGLGIGALLAARADVSRAHVSLIDLSGVLGMLVGTSSAELIEDSFSERTPHFALLGMTLGLITGAYLTRNMDEPKVLRDINASFSTATTPEGRVVPTIGIGGRF